MQKSFKQDSVLKKHIAPALEELGIRSSGRTFLSYSRKTPPPVVTIRLKLGRSKLTNDLLFDGRIELFVPGLDDLVRRVIGSAAPPDDWNWSAVAFICALPSPKGRARFGDWTARDEESFVKKMPVFAKQLRTRLPPLINICESMKSFAELSNDAILHSIGITPTEFFTSYLCLSCFESGDVAAANKIIEQMSGPSDAEIRIRLAKYIKNGAAATIEPQA